MQSWLEVTVFATYPCWNERAGSAVNSSTRRIVVLLAAIVFYFYFYFFLPLREITVVTRVVGFENVIRSGFHITIAYIVRNFMFIKYNADKWATELEVKILKGCRPHFQTLWQHRLLNANARAIIRISIYIERISESFQSWLYIISIEER